MRCPPSFIEPNSVARGREIVSKMRSIIPRQMYDVAIQAVIGVNVSCP